jgi:pimeloyl-ACP methyl ester carboxylesterase
MESRDADRSRVTLRDHVDAVVGAIDACGPDQVVLVGHSAGCGTAHAAVDARPDRVARVVHVAGDEAATLLGFLDYQRATLGWKCSGLDDAGLQATVGASSMTLGGLLKHHNGHADPLRESVDGAVGE